MSKSRIAVPSLVLALSLAACGPAQQAGPASAAPPPVVELIPRAALFAAPERKAAALSPDGKWIGYLVAVEKGYDLVAASADDLVDVRKLARGVDDFSWVGALALYRDAEGYHVADPATPDPDTPRAVLAGPGNRFLAANPSRPGRAVLMVGQRGEVFELDLASSAQASLMHNGEQFSELLLDARGRPAIAARRGEVWALTPEMRKVLTLAPGEAGAPLLLALTPNGASVYLNASPGRDKRALLRLDLASGVVTPIAENQNADIAGALFAPDGAASAYVSEGLRREWTALTPQARSDFEMLGQSLKPGYRVLSRAADDGRWLVEEIAPQQSPRVFLYDRKAKTVDRVLSALPPIEERTLQPTRAIPIPGRGKYTLPVWLTLPLAADPDGDGKANAAAPLVVLVGGAHDRFGYNALTQMLANRGYAVLALTPRGGEGFGKAFAAAGDVGQALLADVADVTRWAVAQQIATAGKAAIIGEGDGGYAAAAALTFTPDEYACAVAVDGPMNLLMAPVGDASAWAAALKTPDSQAKLKAISPWFHAEKVKKPLLLVRRQANEEAANFVAAIKTNKGPIAYAVYRDGGDAFTTVPDRMSFAALSSAFLSKCLGGTADPIGSDFRGSTLQIVEGGALIPDLANALTPRDSDLAAPP
jgi:Prolyl oligopeptidase family